MLNLQAQILKNSICAEIFSENDASETPEVRSQKFTMMFSTDVYVAAAHANTELDKLPEIKCICGFRVFTKIRPEMAKTVNAMASKF